ncbi:uncharacterized protein G2W53_037861 [Senna tora]|uniref:Uncharacterized protein n=1 Tax=Senna tora TaxID=362788 RepID=A0A834W1J8_9FABA|nr:uncharacterized protein G2W53_037861 [Senna tora]
MVTTTEQKAIEETIVETIVAR